jgi:predicted ATPase/DNA-binding SARP family transcriptional activator
MKPPPPVLHLVGRPRFEHAGGSELLPCDRRSQLLVRLARGGDWVARSELAALLWPALERSRALANLRKTLHLARLLPGGETLESSAEALRWRVETDLGARPGEPPLRGRLLDGFDDSANEAWTAWLDAERVAFEREAQRRAHQRLTDAAADPVHSERLARELLAADPFDEDAVVALLAAQRTLQRFDDQRQTYRDYAQRLDDELGVEPSQRVRAQLLSLPAQPAAAASAGPDALLGRGAEIDVLLDALARPDARVVLVTGPGGVGKSTLLKATLRQWRSAVPPCWLALDDLRDAAQAQARLAVELGLGPEAGRDAAAAIAARLAEQPRLLAFDNCEHIEGIERLAQRCLDANPQVRLLASSRRRFDLAPARVLALEGLALPPPDASPDALSRSDAWRLFVRAAREANPALETHGSGAAAIGRIVRQLGGLPLAILLAAAWVRHLPLDRIEADVGESLDLLESQAEGEERPEHRSQRATFELSWRALAVHEQRALAALSVFPGDGSRAAALAVAEASPPLLAQLADKSLLRFSEEGRVSLHPLLRRFAAEKLDGVALEAARRRHARFFLQWMALHAPAFDRVELPLLREFALELENCRAAWRWAVDQGAHEALADATPAVKQHFSLQGAAPDGIALLAAALPALPAEAPRAHAVLHLALAQLQSRVGAIDAAEDHARRALAQARAAGRRELIGRGLLVLGGNQLHWGRSREARRLYEQAERHALSAHDRLGASLALGGQAMVLCDLGNHARAAQVTEEAIGHYRALAQWARLVVNLNNLAYIRLVQQDWRGAEAAAAEGMALCEREGIEHTKPSLWLNLAVATDAQGRPDEADRYCEASIALARRHANRDIEANAAAQQVRVALSRGDLVRARERLRMALPLARPAPHRQARLDLLLSHLRIASAEGQAQPTRDWLRWYLEQPYLEPIDRATAEACLAHLGPARVARRRRATALAPLSLDQMLSQIEAALR